MSGRLLVPAPKRPPPSRCLKSCTHQARRRPLLFLHSIKFAGVTTMTTGFLGSLTLLFVAAKLLGLIHWSWWLVFAPLLVNFAVVGLFFLIGLATVLFEGP